MELVLLPKAEADRDYWKKTGNTAIMNRISALLADIMEHPFSGIGKPEPLKHQLQGKTKVVVKDEALLKKLSAIKKIAASIVL